MEPKVRPKEAKGDQRGAKKKPKSTKMRPRVGTPKKIDVGVVLESKCWFFLFDRFRSKTHPKIYAKIGAENT